LLSSATYSSTRLAFHSVNMRREAEDKPRIRKPLEPRHKEVIEQRKREEGFNVYLRGANEDRVAEQRKREIVTKGRELSQERKQPRKQWEAPVLQPTPTPAPLLHPDAFPQRKKWTEPDEDQYSDSFEEDMEDLPPPEQSEEVVLDLLKHADKRQMEVIRQSIPSLGQSLEEDDPLREIFHQIRNLDGLQQQRLTEMLAGKRQVSKPKPVLHKHKRPYSGSERKSQSQQPQSYQPSQPAQHELVLRVLSTWGHAYQAGLTEIELLSLTGLKIPIPPALIRARNEEGSSLANPSKMVDGVARTEDEKHMWVGQMPAPPACLEIVLSYPPTEVLGGIRVWNYNKSFLDSIKGVKEVEVVLDGGLVWSGTVTRGSGDAATDYSTEISIHPDVQFSGRKDSSDSEFKPEEVAEVQKQMELIERPNSVPSWLKRPEPAKNEEIPVLTAASSRRNRSAARLRPPEPVLADIQFEDPASTSVLHFPKSSKTAREEVKPKEQENLKESLDSLEYFKLSHKGRIAGGRQKLDGTIKGDPLDALIGKPIEEVSVQEEGEREEPALPYDDPLDRFIVRQAKVPVQPVQVPSLPTGKRFKFSILSTWGDQHYVGLCGLEFFDDRGSPIKFRSIVQSITAVPLDVNVLPGYGSDPRVVANLLDGTNWTCDDLHVWLAPFSSGQEHYITIDMDHQVTLSLIRIWNYNKSRIHSARGVRGLAITLDNRTIFRGEIAQAPGRMKEADQFCEYLLFTQDEKLLKAIERRDWVKGFEEANSQEIEAELMTTIRPSNRPGTASREEPKNSASVGEDGRPMTSAIRVPKAAKVVKMSAGLTGQRLRLNIVSTWGDKYYVGLTGVEVLGAGGRPIQVKPGWVDGQPRDMNCIPGYSGDYRTLDKLLDSCNATMDDHHMWLVPFNPGQPHLLWIDLQSPTPITGLRLWNYNKNLEDTCRGVRSLEVHIDNQPAGVLTLRKAPGVPGVDFGQVFQLPFVDTLGEEMKVGIGGTRFASDIVQQTYETPCMPVGYTLKLRLLSTWGDVHFIGLNGLELFDQRGRRLLAQPSFSLEANPPSIQILPGHERDQRTIDKLVDSVNNTYDDRHMWLAPFANSDQFMPTGGPRVNEVVLTFERQVAISYVLLWNYAKTPARGVKEYEILLDDLLLYHGFLRPAPPPGSGDFACAVLFTGDRAIIDSVRPLAYLSPKEHLNIQMYNERKLVSGTQETRRPESARPSTSVVGK